MFWIMSHLNILVTSSEKQSSSSAVFCYRGLTCHGTPLQSSSSAVFFCYRGLTCHSTPLQSRLLDFCTTSTALIVGCLQTALNWTQIKQSICLVLHNSSKRQDMCNWRLAGLMLFSTSITKSPCMTFNCIRSTCPAYFRDVCHQWRLLMCARQPSLCRSRWSGRA